MVLNVSVDQFLIESPWLRWVAQPSHASRDSWQLSGGRSSVRRSVYIGLHMNYSDDYLLDNLDFN